MGVVGWGRPDYAGSTASPVAPKVDKPVDPNVYPGETIDPGESGVHVATIQAALGIKPVDGQYGPVTKKAVIAFQKANPKCGKADGIIGPVTWKAILKQA
jgi:peptidoglycan hydrolase-like protein with peptidoglycan-binding domain